MPPKSYPKPKLPILSESTRTTEKTAEEHAKSSTFDRAVRKIQITPEIPLDVFSKE